MKRCFVMILGFLFSFQMFAQRQGDNWYFGGHVGIRFNPSGTINTYTNGGTNANNNLEGTATISDSAGNLLFYTDGQSVWNRNHVVMSNGTGLMGSYSSTQAGVIVPHPRSTDTFYIFTVDDCQHNLANGLRYSIVKMSLNGGLGGVTTTKNVLLSPAGVPMAEKITSVKHCNNHDIWVIGHGYGATHGQKFYAWLITNNGIQSPVISSIGTVHNGCQEGSYPGVGNARGYMKAAPNGSKIAVAICYDGAGSNTSPTAATTGSFEVFDFNYTTGVVSNPIKFYGSSYKGAYGIEFSPNCQLLYGSTWGMYNAPRTVIQWNLAAGTSTQVQNSAVTVATKASSYEPCALQIASNGKIYVAINHDVSNSSQYLDAINYPNKVGTSCGYTANSLYICNSGFGAQYGPRCGLPTFIQSYFDPRHGFAYYDNFEDMTSKFDIADSNRIDSVKWNFDDPASGSLNYSTLFSPYHLFPDTGDYDILLVIYRCNIIDSIIHRIHIYPRPNTGYTVDNDTQCFKQNYIHFTNTTTIESGTVVYYKWYFGDGDTSNQTNPVHHYPHPGRFLVKLVATSDMGGKDSITGYIKVLHSPHAEFEIDDTTQCLRGNSFIFDNESTISTTSTLTYSWNFGNGYTTTSAYPSAYTYSTAGNYNVRLVVKSDSNCYDTQISHVYVYHMPVAGFTMNDTTQCFKANNVVFTNTTTIASGYNSWQWKFDDNSTDTNRNTSHHYNFADTFNVKLKAISNRGCIDSIIKKVYIYPNPTATFSVNDTTQCLSGNSFVFTNNSTITPSAYSLSYFWRFGDNTTASTTNATHSYTSDDTLTARLVVTSAVNGCQDSFTRTIITYPMPHAQYAVSDTSKCLTGNTFTFTNQTTLVWGTKTYLWRFGDNTTSTTPNPAHSYSTYGNYTARLISTSGMGCSDSFSRTIYVRPMPVTSFSINDSTQCILGNNFVFTNTSSIASGTITYSWNLGNGNTSTSSTSVSQTYTTSSNLLVKLVTTSNYGCKDSVSRRIYVFPMPDASFSINDNTQCKRGNNFLFTDLSTISSGSFTHNWNFGDFTSSTLQNPSHSYSNDGNYSVRLIVTSAMGCPDTAIQSLDVYPMPNFIVSVNDTDQCFNGHNFVFTNNSLINSGTQAFLWNFGDGTTSTQTSPSHQYAIDSTFRVKLLSVSNWGCRDSIYFRCYVYPNPHTIYSINDSDQCFKGNSFTFSNSSWIHTGSFTNKWYFGDNSTSLTASPVHQYTAFGTYPVKLVTTSNLGCKDSVTKTAYVFATPVPSFSINDSNQCFENQTFAFTNGTTIGAGSFSSLWKFGDNTTSTSSSPVHTYATDDTFYVKLIATSNLGCKDSLSKKVYIFPNPVSNFSISDSNQCFKGNNFSFTNLSAINTGSQTYRWYFGDGGTVTTTNAAHQYTWDDTFAVKLVSTSNLGCKDSVTKFVYIFPTPVPSFSIDDSDQCYRAHHFNFLNTTTQNTGTFSNFWRFGDGANSAQYSPGHIYSTTGTFQVRLIATSNLGCSDSVNHNVYVYPNPASNFTINDSDQCFKGNSYSFTNISTISSGTLTHLWNFGDGTTSTLNSPSRNYIYDDTFTVKLISTSNQGCKDSITKRAFVWPTPVPAFTVSDTSLCLSGNSFSFTNNSTLHKGTNSYNWAFGDGGVSNLINPTHSYPTYNTFRVRLMATSNFGCIDSSWRNLYVRPMPDAVISVNDSTQCVRGNSYSFTNSTTIPSGTMTYYWTFDDGTNSSVTSPVHVYTTYDTFRVKMMATSGFGCKDSAFITSVVFPMPVSGFGINDSTQCLRGNSFSFTNNTTIPYGSNTYVWKYGNGNQSTAVNPVYTYPADDTFSVKLIATSANGCKDSISNTVYVWPMPDAQFSVNDSVQCMTGNNFIYTNLSTISSGTMNSNWFLGDGDTSQSTNPSHHYIFFDTFNVRLISISNLGCNDTAYHFVAVHYMPTADFAINDDSQCFLGNQFVLTNNSSITLGTLTYNWNFADGNNSTSVNNTHSYTYDDTFSIKLVTTSQQNCQDSITKQVYVWPMPKAQYSLTDTSQCFESNAFLFLNQSTINSGPMFYSWFFGDNDSSNQTSPVHSYSFPDTFNIKLIVRSLWGCSDSVFGQVHVHVHPQPSADFTIDSAKQCLRGNSFNYSNTSTIASGTFTNLWEFGDNFTSTTLNTNHVYGIQDTFLVKLLVTSNWGCKDSVLKNVVVHPMPVSQFTIDDNSQCLYGNSFTLTSTSSIPYGNYSLNWFLGDGDTASQNIISHTYTAHDTFLVSLVATSALKCRDSSALPVYVHPMPVAAFSINDSGQCVRGNNFSFTNSSSITSGTMNYNWNFGDAQTSLLTNPAHTYSSYDTFDVKLLVTSALGCKDSVNHITYTFPMPVSGFTINDSNQCLFNNGFVFTNNSTIPYGTNSYFWDFGDGDTSIITNSNHSYSAFDTLYVKLIATSLLNCKDSISKKVYIFPDPVSDFAFNDSSQCFNGNNFITSNLSTIAYGNLTYNWNFGDGFNSTLTNPSHPFTTDDTFKVRLISTSNLGCRDTIIKPAYVFPSPASNFNINIPAQCEDGNRFVFANTSTINTGIMNYLWNFGDMATSVLQNPVHSYSSFDTFSVKLVVTSLLGCSDSITKNTVVHPHPVGAFTINDSSQCLVGNSFNFTNNTSIPYGTINYSWNFGDGGSSALINPVHAYSTFDTFFVKLIAVSGNGCKDSLEKPAMVRPMPKTGFAINDYSQCLSGNNFQFTDKSTIAYGALYYAWYFGDGNSSGLKNPDHTYGASNSYQVKLISTSGYNCKDSITKQVHVNPMPLTNFLINDSTQCLAGNNFSFSNLSNIMDGAISSFWRFGDNQTSTTTNPTHSYTSDGIYNVTLISTSDSGCLDSMKKTIWVHPMPVADFRFTTPCLLDPVSFDDRSTIGNPDNLSQWIWNFGDTTFSAIQNPDHTYIYPGVFKVWLKVVSDKGCSDSISKNVQIFDRINAPEIERATVAGKSILVEWNPIVTGRPKSFTLERSTDSITFTQVATFSTSALSYMDYNVSPDIRHYYYRLFAEDSCGYVSPYSNIGKTIFLKVNNLGEYPVLHWTPYQYWATGIKGYEVLVFSSKDNKFEVLDQVSDTSGWYEDTRSSLDQGDYCYEVRALRNNDLLESVSNEVCIPTPFNIWVPNAFTPNGDGLNDSFKVNGRFIVSYRIRIYDRWGGEIFHSDDIYHNWDGTFNGDLCPEGAYYYTIWAKGTGAQRKIINGTVNLLHQK